MRSRSSPPGQRHCGRPGRGGPGLAARPGGACCPARGGAGCPARGGAGCPARGGAGCPARGGAGCPARGGRRPLHSRQHVPAPVPAAAWPACGGCRGTAGPGRPAAAPRSGWAVLDRPLAAGLIALAGAAVFVLLRLGLAAGGNITEFARAAAPFSHRGLVPPGLAVAGSMATTASSTTGWRSTPRTCTGPHSGSPWTRRSGCCASATRRWPGRCPWGGTPGCRPHWWPSTCWRSVRSGCAAAARGPGRTARLLGAAAGGLLRVLHEPRQRPHRTGGRRLPARRGAGGAPGAPAYRRAAVRVRGPDPGDRHRGGAGAGAGPADGGGPGAGPGRPGPTSPGSCRWPCSRPGSWCSAPRPAPSSC